METLKILCVATAMVAFGSQAAAQTYGKTKLMQADGKERNVQLAFDKEKEALVVRAGEGPLYNVSYSAIGKLSYEEASRHRVKEGAIVMIFSLGAGGVVMLTKAKYHWLYVDYKDDTGQEKTLTLKLDKSEYRGVLAVAAAQTGKTVDTLPPLKGAGGKGQGKK